MEGVIFDVQTYALYDGPGIRTTVYLKGCPLRCLWCHNPEAWADSASSERAISAADLVQSVLLDRPFFEASGGGVTFSGGEPTVQAEFLLEALELLQGQGIHTALETSGQFRASLCEPLAKLVDLFLFDLKHADDLEHKAGTGVGNRGIVGNLERLVALVGTERIVPRLPIVPGFNDSPESVEPLLALLESLGFAGDVHLMPYHAWARKKYEDLGLEFHDMGTLGPASRAATQCLFEGRRLRPVWRGAA